MGHVRTIAKNSLWSLSDSLLGMVNSLGCSIAVARVMGPEKLGYYNYINTMTIMAGWIAAFGIPAATRRFAAEAIGRGQFGVARTVIRVTFRVQLYMALIATVGGVAAVIGFVPRVHWSFALVTMASVLPFLMYGIPSAAITATEDLSPNVRASLVSTVVSGGTTAAALIFHWGLPGLATSILASRATDYALRQLFFKRIYAHLPGADAPPEPLSPELKKKILNFCWQVTAITALDILVWDRSEMFFLGKYSTIVEVAFYSLAFNLSQNLLLLPRVATTAAGATIAVQHGRDPKTTSGLAIGTMRVLALICVPAAFGMSALAGPILRFAYGAKYIPAIPMFSLLAVFTLGRALQLPARQLLSSTDRQAALLKWGSALAVLNLILDFTMIPRGGAMGAAIAKSIVMSVGAVSVWWMVAVSFGTRLPLGRLARVTIASLVMFVGVKAMVRVVPPAAAVALGPPLGIALVLMLFRLLRCLSPEDQEPLRAVGRKIPARFRGGWTKVVEFLFPDAAPPVLVPGPEA
jgi:O-antigen/teichoic acid export membrane protein